MARNEIEIDAPPAAVWAVLADPAQYAEWVIGTDRIRDADEGWPAPGSRLYHSVGAAGATLDDVSEVLEAEEPRRLVLLARLGPLGTLRVDMTLEEAAGGGTRVRFVEEPETGVVAAAAPATSVAVRGRNALSLRSLKKLVERT